LTLLPVLLGSDVAGVDELALMIASNASSKETVLALKESGEKIRSFEEIEEDEEGQEFGRLIPHPKCCALMIQLYARGECVQQN
jgi:hypothetical protein